MVRELKQLDIDKSSWENAKFGDLVKEPKENSKNPLAEGIEHVVGLEHIDSENIHLSRSASIEESTTFTKKFSKGDVLFGRRRAYLKKAAQAAFSGICSGDITVLRAKEGLLPELLPFIVCNDKFFDYAIKHSAGGLSPRVKFKDLANYEFLLPPKDQQKQLAELLWAMDEVIEKEKVVLERLEVIYERILFDFFESDKKYPQKKLGEFVLIKSGDSPSGFEFVEKKSGIPFIKVADLNESTQYQDFAKEWVIPKENKIVPKGSVIFPKRGAAIMTNKVRITKEECHMDTNTMALIIRNEVELSNLFLFYFLYYKKLYKIADTSQIPQINNVHINPYPINIPPIEKQNSLLRKLNELISMKEQIKSKILHSKSLQKSLINQIF